MAYALLGLLASIALYLAAIYGITWSWSLRYRAAESHGVQIDASPIRFPTGSEIWHRHSVEWTIGFTIFFVILTIFDFPLWQQLCITGALAIVFGSAWLAQSESGGLAEEAPRFRRLGSSVWYWLLGVGDWLGYLGVICFAIAVLASIL